MVQTEKISFGLRFIFHALNWKITIEDYQNTKVWRTQSLIQYCDRNRNSLKTNIMTRKKFLEKLRNNWLTQRKVPTLFIATSLICCKNSRRNSPLIANFWVLEFNINVRHVWDKKTSSVQPKHIARNSPCSHSINEWIKFTYVCHVCYTRQTLLHTAWKRPLILLLNREGMAEGHLKY